ncbi:hypothetical protein FJY69_05670 [candidate division WOR-3 bacterium]|nr:hypothetical protein [candidate division WOR-3 bacterium]
MKIDGLDWLDWLHRIRAESEAERKRQGLSIAERLVRAEAVAERIERELSARDTPVARDRPRKPKSDE